ncbi:MAG: efflux RND transporter periplasmic adaptor subunit [Anaerolineaceae bacterium]|nr:efflux RND transporter periplasmic adaptor subunit [Anaerolineaceae bacterium]
MIQRFQKIPKVIRIIGGLVVAALLVFVVVRFVLPSSNTSTTTYQTYVVKRGPLNATISATGSVQSNQTANLTWSVNAKVGQVNVAIGQPVKKDDILMVLDPTSLPQSLIQAQSDLINAKNALQDLYDKGSTNTATASQVLAKAEDDLETAKNKRLWLNGSHRASDSQIKKDEGDYYLALDLVDKMQEIYDSTDSLDATDPKRAKAQSDLGAAQLRLQNAEWQLEYDRGKPDANDIALADANLAVAQAKYDDAKRTFEDLKNGVPSDDVTVAQNRVDIAQASVNLTRLTAPFDGTITDLDTKVGDVVLPNTFALRVDDLSALLVKVQVSEVDINRLAADQPATITFDAINGKTYNGKVIEVGRAGTTTGGVVYFPVTVQLTDADEQVKPGMTASVTVTVEYRENVLMIPSRAVRTISGKRMVYTMDASGELTQIEVKLGSMAEANVEIVEGLKEGDVIVTNPPATNTLMTPGGGRPGGPGGGMPGN